MKETQTDRQRTQGTKKKTILIKSRSEEGERDMEEKLKGGTKWNGD